MKEQDIIKDKTTIPDVNELKKPMKNQWLLENLIIY